jgi:hypothetical protein
MIPEVFPMSLADIWPFMPGRHSDKEYASCSEQANHQTCVKTEMLPNIYRVVPFFEPEMKVLEPPPDFLTSLR